MRRLLLDRSARNLVIFLSRIIGVSEQNERFCSCLTHFRRASYSSGSEPGPQRFFLETANIINERQNKEIIAIESSYR